MGLFSEHTKELMSETRIFIKEVGFPISVAIWLLWEAHTTIRDLTFTLTRVASTMQMIEQNLTQKNEGR